MLHQWTLRAIGRYCPGLALAIVLLLVSRVGAAAPPDFASVLPSGAVAYVELNDLGTVIDRLKHSDYLAAVLESPQLKQFEKSPEYRKAEAARLIAQRQLGIDPLELLQKLTARRLAVALYPNEMNAQQPHSIGLLTAEPEVLANLRKQIDPLLTLASDIVQTTPGPHGGELLSIGGKAFVAWKDDWVAVSSQRNLLDDLVERLHQARPGNLADDESFRAMRGALAKAPARTGRENDSGKSLRLFQGYVNVATINKAAGGRAIPPKLDNALASLLFGDSMEMAARSPFAALTVDLDDHGVALAVSVADSRGASEAHRSFFPPAGQPAVAALPAVPDLIGGLSIYRDFADWYMHREQLLQEQTLPGFDQFESGIANILPGRDFGEDILPTLGKRLTLLAAPQTYEHLGSAPGIRLPGFALVVELGRAEEGADLMQLVFQTLTAIGNLSAGQQGRQPWVMTSETHAGVQISYAKYSKKPTGDPLNIVYNFLPAAARVDNHFIMSSSLGLCRQLVDSLKQPQGAAQPDATELPRTLDTQLRFDPLTDMIAANQEFFLGRLVQQGRTADQAKQEFDLFVNVLRRFDGLHLCTVLGDGLFQVRLEGSWK